MTAGKIRGLLFDMDGVILDTERIWLECWKEAGVRWRMPDVLRTCYDCIGITREASEALFDSRHGQIVSYRLFAEELSNRFREKTRDGVPAKPGAAQVLHRLREADWPLALVSSTDGKTIRAELEPLGLYALFDTIISGEMVLHSKPAPDAFLQAAAALGIPPAECCAVEDSYNGIQAAHAAGCLPIMVPDLLQPTPQIRSLCWRVCGSLAEAYDCLIRRE